MSTSGSVTSLWHQYKDAGDRAARDRLVIHYSPLVKFVAGRVRAGLPPGADQDDLISDGVVGLMGAIESFDLGRGLQFQTYAQQRIRGAMIDGLRASDWVPRLVREQMRATNTATATLEHRLQRRPRGTEVAAELGISERELDKRTSQGSYAQVSHLEWDQVENDVTSVATEGMPDDLEDLPDDLVSAIDGLPERQRIIMALYYWERLSLDEIGQVLGVSESRVSQVLRLATLELRRNVS